MEQKKLEIEYNNQTYEKELFSNYKELVNEIDKEFKIPTYQIYDNKEKEITEENYQNFIKNNNKPKIIIKEIFTESKYPENNIIISGMDENVKKKEKKTEVFFLDDSNIENSSKQNIKINEKKNDNEKQSKEKKENKDNENKNRDKEKELYDKIQNLENENKQLKEKIKNLENENNELKEKLLNEKKIENLNNTYTSKGNQIIKKTVKVGEKSLVIHITIKNNGRYIYDEDSKLVCDPKSEIKCDSVKIKPLKPNEEEIVYVFFNDLDKYEKGHEYLTYLNLKVGNKIIGKQIQIKLIILMEDSEYLKRFREDFNLGNNYSDSKLLKYLKNFDYNFNKAFQAFVNNNNNN
jgi:hypothetical protein